jgi:homocysteine S-methyltransferase
VRLLPRFAVANTTIGGAIGPRGDGYRPGPRIDPDEAATYHRRQVDAFAEAGADIATAYTLTDPGEAIGIVMAARAAGIPVGISFTVETDGRLPSGQRLDEAIEQVDADTEAAAAYFMLNCAHPTHFSAVLAEDGTWSHRIRGIRANASRKSHAELDASDELDSGDPDELAGQYRTLSSAMPQLTVVGGCCGTDHRHVDAICAAIMS